MPLQRPVNEDRRLFPRHLVNLKALLIYPHQANGPVVGDVFSLNNTGLSILSPTHITTGTNVSISLISPVDKSRMQFIAKLKWSIHKNIDAHTKDAKYLCGFQILESLHKTIDQKINITSLPSSERRIEKKFEHPLKRRNIDYIENSLKSPYHTFTECLKQIPKIAKIKSIVISPNLLYLKKRIRSILVDPMITIPRDISGTLEDDVLLVIDMQCRRRHEAFYLLDFEEYLIKNHVRNEFLSTLDTISKHLNPGQKIYIASLGEIKNQPLASKYLLSKKFKNVKFINNHLIHAEKRQLHLVEMARGYVVQEVEKDLDIDRIQDFAASIFPGEYNFSKEIDDLFRLNSDFYSVLDPRSNKIINFTRVSWHLPGQALPCMLANKKGTDLHLQLYNPDELSYGEVFSPYLNSLSSAKTYGELIKKVYEYGQNDLINVMFSTSNAYDKKALSFFTKTLGFKESGMILKYGNFGEDWNLIYSTKKDFNQRLEMNLISKDKHPSFFSSLH